jgi:glycosyltransferase involved in cell wall biosynthesis
MESLRFLMVTTHYPPYHLGGDARFVEYLSQELALRGHEVHILSSPNVFELLREGESKSRKVEDKSVVRHEYRPEIGRIDPVLSLVLNSGQRPLRQLTEVTRQVKPDIVHWHNSKGFLGRPISTRGATNLYTAHDYYAVCPRSNLLRVGSRICKDPILCQFCLLGWKKPPQLWRALGKRVVRLQPDFTVISPSQFVADRLREDGIATGNLVRNFVPDSHSHTRGRENRDTLLFLGLLEGHKGPQSLLEAFAKSSARQNFRLSMVGEGSFKTRLRERVAQLGLTERVDVPGFLPNEALEDVFKRAAALVVPSEWYENAPLVVLEGFSRGIPVIGSNMGGLPEILTKESGSLVYHSGDVGALAECIESMWNGHHLVEESGRKARNEYLAKFTPEAHIKTYFNVLGNPSG